MKNKKVLTRRKFLRTSGAALSTWALASALPLTALSAAGPRRKEECDVLVLGAGMAGVSAARALRRYGNARKVIVLEGSGRIGGRIHTLHDRFAGPVELGAEYVHRAPGTVPLWNDIQALGLPWKKIPKIANSLVYHDGWQGNKLRSSVEMGLSFEDLASWNILEALSIFDSVNAYNSTADISAAEFLMRRPAGLGRDMMEMLLSGHMPAPAERLSLRGFISDRLTEQLRESHEYSIESGYSSLLEGMNARQDVRFHEIVDSITSDESGVEARTQSGRTYRAKALVCTFSIGMLKSGIVEFRPGLPREKLDALEQIEAGHHSKVALEFREKFWPADMGILSRADDRHRAGRSYFHLFYGEAKKPAMLTALIMGDDAKKTRSLTDLELVQRICADLDEIFPKKSAPAFRLLAQDARGRLSFQRKQWMDDPFARGGNAYIALDPAKDPTRARATLADPELTPRIFWAGEALAIDTQPASVHGAHASGIRAALETEEFLRTGKIRQLLKWELAARLGEKSEPVSMGR